MLYTWEFWKSIYLAKSPRKLTGKKIYWVLAMEVEETCHQNVCANLLSAVVFFNLLRPIYRWWFQSGKLVARGERTMEFKTEIICPGVSSQDKAKLKQLDFLVWNHLLGKVHQLFKGFKYTSQSPVASLCHSQPNPSVGDCHPSAFLARTLYYGCFKMGKPQLK